MWTRKELKEKGKRSFNRNYWKCVLVSLLALMLLGGSVGGSGGSWNAMTGFGGNGAAAGTAAGIVSETPDITDDINDVPDAEDFDDFDDIADPDLEMFGTDDPEFDAFMSDGPFSFLNGMSGFLLLWLFIIIFLIGAALAILLGAFLINPLSVGASRFFVRNLNTQAEIRELAYAYDNGYLNTVKTMFFKELYTFLWSLLLIIPGIVKSYEYRMIPYLLAEQPDLPMKEAFARSKEMMTGQKWRAFVLDLSFIGWGILSALTLGLLGVFYVNPYRNMTYAALYEALAYGNKESEETAWIES